MRSTLGGVLVYGPLSLKDRLIRAAIGALLGAVAGFILMLRWDFFSLWALHQRSTLLLPAALMGALAGGLLAFRRKQL